MNGTKRDILVFGGSFDPPHRAHVELPTLAARQVGAQEILYMPTGANPQKDEHATTDPHHRMKMLEAALAEEPLASISRLEIERPLPHYTVDTLELLARSPGYEQANMRLLIGADQALNFRTWREWERVMQLAEPLVMPRPPHTLETLPEAYASAHPGEEAIWMSRTLDLPLVDECSTDIREATRQGILLESIVPDVVARYIRDHQLYGFDGSGATIE